ncbi:MAG TPA: aldo/keto reductase [Roseiflexaceae bacterium]|nr:aldo/keto reductase [Roseiflexaceae bacterium]
MHQQIGTTDLQASRVVLGCMTLQQEPRAALATIHTALEHGINFFDHADVYQAGRSEETFAAIWQESPGLRDRIILQSKCGIRQAGEPDARAPKRYDFSRDYIVPAVEGSLRRLKTAYLDILLLHRPDALVEPEEVAEAFSRLEARGMVRHFGVSNHNAAQIDLLQAYLGKPLVANQLQLSLLHSHLINAGIITNQNHPPHAVRGDGTLEYCRRHRITIQAWSPLANGAITGRLPHDAAERTRQTAGLVAQLAAEKGVSAEAIALAWILRHPARMQVIVGTTNHERIAACMAANHVELSREEWYLLFMTGRGYPIS